jgi:hypothetical protein
VQQCALQCADFGFKAQDQKKGQPITFHIVRLTAEPLRLYARPYDSQAVRLKSAIIPTLGQQLGQHLREHGYSVNIYNRSTDSWPTPLRSQFGQRYVHKKVGNR